MIQGNVGGPGIRVGTLNRRDDMAAYDALPARLRLQIREMSICWNATPVREIAAKHGVDGTLAALRKVERDLMAANDGRIPL